MTEKRVQASEFKAKCLALLDDVAQHRVEVVVTKHGRPVARVIPIDEPASTSDSVSLLSDDEDAYFSTGERWNGQD